MSSSGEGRAYDPEAAVHVGFEGVSQDSSNVLFVAEMASNVVFERKINGVGSSVGTQLVRFRLSGFSGMLLSGLMRAVSGLP
jgi:hypothetical protein